MQALVVAAGAAAAAGAVAYVAYRRRLLARLITSARLAMNPDSIVDVAQRAEDLGVSRQRISSLVRSMPRCPRGSERLAEALLSLGLYEDVVYLASRGCSVHSTTLSRARAYSMGLGLSKWETEASRLLGEQPRLLGSSKVMVAFCEGGHVEVMVDGVVSEVPPPGGSWRSPPQDEVMSSIAQLSGAQLLISWGPCNLKGAVDAKLLLSIAYPDVRPSIASIAYNLGLNPMLPPSAIVLAAVRASVEALSRVGVDWSTMPEAVRGAEAIAKFKDIVDRVVGQQSPREGRAIVVTDRPRAFMPVWRPFLVDPSRAKGVSYQVLASLRSLTSRGGDPLRALRNAPLLGDFGKALAEALRASLVPATAGPRPGSQVEPWDLACLGDLEVTLDCARSYELCLRPQAPPPDEEELLRSLRVRCPGGSNIRFSASTYVPRRLAEALGLSAPSKGRVKAYGELIAGGPRGASDAVASALAMTSRASRPLIVVPSRALAEATAKAYGIPLVTPDAVDTWTVRGGPGVIPWDDYLAAPEAAGVADTTVLVFPERMIWAEQDDTPYGVHGKLVDAVVELVAKNGGMAVSRALQAEASSRDDVELVEPPASGAAQVNIGPEDIMAEAERAFRRLWGEGAQLRPYQRLAIRVLAEMASRGTSSALMAILPTGAGKSAIFQVSARALEDMGLGSTAIVISPLRALMHDQVRNAKQRGLRAAYIDSGVPPSRKGEIIAAAKEGLLDLVYVTPEGFGTGAASELARSAGQASLAVLDEAHTLSRWGLSFRPSYLYVARQLREASSSSWPPMLALTASAPPDVVKDIMEELGLGEHEEHRISLGVETEDIHFSGRPIVLRAPSIRPEISIDVVMARSGRERLDDIADRVEELTKWADSLGGPWVGVVFVPFVQSSSEPWLNADEVAKAINGRLGEEVLVYHGQLGEARRREVEERIIMSSRTGRGPRVVVATKAFGMGVDIPNIRWTLHAAPSESVEDMYQEIGRAGRDGKPARAVILYNPSDLEARKAMARGDAIKPLRVQRALNIIEGTLESLRRREGPAPLPIKDASGEWGLVRYLDVLRMTGVIDYEVIRGPVLAYDAPRERVEEEAGWCAELREGQCLSRAIRGLEGRRAFLNLCDGRASISLEQAQGCKAVSYDSLVALVSPSPDWKKPKKYLDPELYATTLWLSLREVRKLRELSELLEAAVAARARGGPALVDSQVKRMMDESLARGVRPPLGGVRLGRVVRCDTAEECVEQAVMDAAEIERLVGEGSVVVGASGVAASLFSARYLRQTGRSPQVSVSYYRKLAALARRGELEKAMNMGYVIIIARQGAKVEEVVKLAHGYPYANFYLYARRT
ncbi:DEAD/DEAH box helicase [Acidilobus sp. 7A]|uniref:DEAD/DEAH box helicase n=1 Tax=Acidilobus sp. 7A TaxID=1577685 RepID=UPI000764E881|nr:DEAD/DEAH box helicase [Acidilobus sp. 7A]AMD30200.1 hypothetical protein SE86_00800 [Acidilobus sp. 7A]